jgi:hypothetical protein
MELTDLQQVLAWFPPAFGHLEHSSLGQIKAAVSGSSTTRRPRCDALQCGKHEQGFCELVQTLQDRSTICSASKREVGFNLQNLKYSSSISFEKVNNSKGLVELWFVWSPPNSQPPWTWFLGTNQSKRSFKSRHQALSQLKKSIVT